MVYKTSGVCSSAISFEIDDAGKVHNVKFQGGCSGNTQGVARLVEGMDAKEAISRMEGIRCGFKPTSCPDQLAQALKQAEELDVVLIPYELAKGMEETKQIIAGIRPGQSVGIFIGPEGGFEEEEVALAMKTGANPVTLGKRILRTETAGLTMLSVLMFHLEG